MGSLFTPGGMEDLRGEPESCKREGGECEIFHQGERGEHELLNGEINMIKGGM